MLPCSPSLAKPLLLLASERASERCPGISGQTTGAQEEERGGLGDYLVELVAITGLLADAICPLR